MVSLEGKVIVLSGENRFQGKGVLPEIKREFHNDEMVDSSGSCNNYKPVFVPTNKVSNT